MRDTKRMHPSAARRAPHPQHARGGRRPVSASGFTVPAGDARLPTPRRYMPTDLRYVSQVIAVPDVGELDASEATLSTSDVQQVEFRDDGWIVGFVAMGGDGETSHEGRSALAVKLEIVGSQSAITSDGQTARFIQLSLLCPDVSDVAVEPAPFVRRVMKNDRLNITWANYDTDTGRTPSGAFYFLSDDDCREGAEPLPVGSDEPGCTRFVLVPDQLTTLDSSPLTAGQDGPDGVVEWQQDGTVLAFRADIMMDDDGALSFASVFIEDPETHRAWTNVGGLASGFVPAQLLCAGNSQLMRIRQRRSTFQTTRVVFKNIDEFSSILPQGVFLFRGDEDVRAKRLSP